MSFWPAAVICNSTNSAAGKALEPGYASRTLSGEAARAGEAETAASAITGAMSFASTLMALLGAPARIRPYPL